MPGKNLRMLGGRPLIAQAILAGKACSYIDKVVVSTDSKKIAGVAKDYGATVPFIRPRNFASSRARQVDVINHALTALRSAGDKIDVVLLLQPTSPFRTRKDLDSVCEKLLHHRFDSVATVTKVTSFHPFECYEEFGRGKLRPVLEKDSEFKNRQEYPPVWWRNGQVYGFKASGFLRSMKVLSGSIGFVETAEDQAININSESDWELALKRAETFEFV